MDGQRIMHTRADAFGLQGLGEGVAVAAAHDIEMIGMLHTGAHDRAWR